MKKLLLLLSFISITLTAQAQIQNPQILQLPIKFDKKRIHMTKEYLRKHYGMNQNSIKIIPKMIVIHWTEGSTWISTYKTFYHPEFNFSFDDHKFIGPRGKLNTSSQYLVTRQGVILQLMPDNWMARHVIGLNYMAIGIENVGGMKHPLTNAQIKADVALIRYLKRKYPTIKFLIGHYEYGHFRNTPLWREKDRSYFTYKTDPNPSAMKKIRQGVKDLHLLPRKTYPYPPAPHKKTPT